MPQFSVIIPTYNRAHFIGPAIESVLAQTCTDYEIIVVDDGSTDNTQQVVAAFGDKVRFYAQSNLGVAAARNTAMHYAYGEYLVFLDSDDLMFPWTLATLDRAIVEHGQPSLLMGTGKHFMREQELPLAPAELQMERHADFYRSWQADWYWVTTDAMVVRSDVARRVGGWWRERFNAEDLDFAMRLGTAMQCVRVLSPPTFAYRLHDNHTVNNAAMTFRGVLKLIDNERRGNYPGGAARATERVNCISKTARWAAWELARAGHLKMAFTVYASAFDWNVSLRRWRFLIAMPAVVVGLVVRTKIRRGLQEIAGLLRPGSATTLLSERQHG